jgi:site-specific recombinase XerD
MDDAMVVKATAGEIVNAAMVAQARAYQAHAKAANTWRAYRTDWADFAGWCEQQGLTALPAAPTTVVLYLTALAQAGRKASTIQRRLSAISQFHQASGLASPTHSLHVRTVWAGIRRVHGTAAHGKAPAVTADLKVMLATLPDTLIGLRDRALLLLGFAGAFRRSELVALTVNDLAFTREGLVVTLRRSKTDQEGQGRQIGIPYGSHLETCPVRTLQAWLESAAITEGAVFRAINRHGQLQSGRLSDKAVALIVKRAAAAAGLDPSRYAGHSLRAGLATAAAAAGVSERAIMAQTGHRSVQMVRRYIREGSLFRENAVAQVGL